MIFDNELSFVVQGPIINTGIYNTKEVLLSIRKNFPNSEIVLSTWKGENIQNLEFDKLATSELPESIKLTSKRTCNVNRQIVSTYEGIKIATRKYLVKTRTNTLFDSNILLTKFELKPTNSIFRSYIFTIDLFTRNQYKASINSYHDGFLHHPSDILLIGLRTDLKKLFSCKHAKIETMINRNGLGILVPEQYIWMSLLLRKRIIRNFKNCIVKHNPKSCYISEKTIFDNFKIYNSVSLGINLEDRLINGWMSESVITEEFQNKLDNYSKFEKKIIFAKRAIYNCLIVNHFWRKMHNSLNKTIKRKNKKYKYFFICRR